jgi:hypothetical protein
MRSNVILGLKRQKEWIVCPWTFSAATPVGAITATFLSVISRKHFSNVDLPVPARPVTKMDFSVSSINRKARRNSGLSSILSGGFINSDVTPKGGKRAKEVRHTIPGLTVFRRYPGLAAIGTSRTVAAERLSASGAFPFRSFFFQKLFHSFFLEERQVCYHAHRVFGAVAFIQLLDSGTRILVAFVTETGFGLRQLGTVYDDAAEA